MRPGSFTAALIFAAIAATPLFAGSELTASQILQRAAQADLENRHSAALYVFREVISSRERDLEGKVVGQGTRTFEVTFVEDESYYRLIKINGERLNAEAEAEEQRRYLRAIEYRRSTDAAERQRRRSEAERNRLKFDIGLVARHHQATLLGEEGPPDARVWVLEVKPNRNSPKPRSPAEWALTLRGRLYVDQETLHPVKAELEQAYAWQQQPLGSKATFEWRRIEGTWLIHEISSATPAYAKKSAFWREAVQSYSDYRKFRAQSVLVFAEMQ